MQIDILQASSVIPFYVNNVSVKWYSIIINVTCLNI